jgi:type I restriction enzyme S subunit
MHESACRNREIITSAYLALRVNAGVSPAFGFQFLNVWDTSKAIYGYGSGLRQNLDFSHFKRMPVAVPRSPSRRPLRSSWTGRTGD